MRRGVVLNLLLSSLLLFPLGLRARKSILRAVHGTGHGRKSNTQATSDRSISGRQAKRAATRRTTAQKGERRCVSGIFVYAIVRSSPKASAPSPTPPVARARAHAGGEMADQVGGRGAGDAAVAARLSAGRAAGAPCRTAAATATAATSGERRGSRRQRCRPLGGDRARRPLRSSTPSPPRGRTRCLCGRTAQGQPRSSGIVC